MKKLKLEKNNILGKFTTFEDYLKEQYPTKRKMKEFRDGYERLRLGYVIFLARKQKKITQAQLAKKLNTTQSVIARIETGEQNLSNDKLHKIAHALDKQVKIELV